MDRMRRLVGLFFVVVVAAMLAPAAGCSIHTRAPWAPKEVAPAPLELTVVYDRQITVDYRKKIGALIKEGQYDRVGTNITAGNFPRSAGSPQGVAELTVVLVDTDRLTTSEEILDAMERHGLRPGTLQELLALGAEDPDVQRDYLIIALGSVSVPQPDGDRKVAYLSGDASSRYLEMIDAGRQRNRTRRRVEEKIYFLAVEDGGE